MGTPVKVISVVNNYDMYDRLVTHNSFLKGNDFEFIAFDNRKDNQYISTRYNHFLNHYDYQKPAWFVFCHQDWELLQDIKPVLNKLDKNTLHAAIGMKLEKISEKRYKRRLVGRILDCRKDGSNERFLGTKLKKSEEVHSFDCQLLIVHSSLIEKSGLRFDEKLRFDFYVEDFCFNAKINHAIKSKVIDLKTKHHAQIEEAKDRTLFYETMPYMRRKYKDHLLTTCSIIVGDETVFIEDEGYLIEQDNKIQILGKSTFEHRYFGVYYKQRLKEFRRWLFQIRLKKDSKVIRLFGVYLLKK